MGILKTRVVSVELKHAAVSGNRYVTRRLYLFALDRGQSGTARSEHVFPRRNGSTGMMRIYACNSKNSAFLNSTLIVVCLADDLEHLIY